MCLYLVECSLLCANQQYRVRVKFRFRIIFSVWLVSCYAHVFVRLQVVIVTDQIRVTRLQQTHVEKSTTCIVFTRMRFKSQFFTALQSAISESRGNHKWIEVSVLQPWVGYLFPFQLSFRFRSFCRSAVAIFFPPAFSSCSILSSFFSNLLNFQLPRSDISPDIFTCDECSRWLISAQKSCGIFLNSSRSL